MTSVFVLLEGRAPDINGYEAYDLVSVFENIEAVEQWFARMNTSEAYDHNNWKKAKVLDYWVSLCLNAWEIKALGTDYELVEIRVVEVK